MPRKTKIICTIGPTCDTLEKITQLARAGLDVARLNFSHENHVVHLKRIKLIRKVSKNLKKPIAILADLQGPKLRIGTFANRTAHLSKGKVFILSIKKCVGTAERVYVNYPRLTKDLKTGDIVLIDDGRIKLKVTQCLPTEVHTKVVEGGQISNNKGINIPYASLTIPALTSKDLKDLKFILKNDLDFVALSFVQKAEDIKKLKSIINRQKSRAQVIAKLEKPKAIDNLEAIMHNCDGVMVARGDLGVEIEPENVPALQKHIIKRANQIGIFVITATQMLESMIHNPQPTRAEASDVANAIFDGTDAVMLSGETANGNYPEQSVQMMNKIIREAESHPQFMFDQVDLDDLEIERDRTIPQTISHAAWLSDRNLKFKKIVAFSTSGRCALMISKHRPRAIVMGVTPNEDTYRRMGMYWGVYSVLMKEDRNIDKMFKQINKLLIKNKWAKKGDLIAIVSGPVGEKGSTNNLRVQQVR